MRKNIVTATMFSCIFILLIFTFVGCIAIKNHPNQLEYVIPTGEPKGYVDFYWNYSRPLGAVRITRGKEPCWGYSGLLLKADPKIMTLGCWVNRMEVRPGFHDFIITLDARNAIPDIIDTIQVEVFEGKITPIEVSYPYELKSILPTYSYLGPKVIPSAYAPKKTKEEYNSKEAKEARKLKLNAVR